MGVARTTSVALLMSQLTSRMISLGALEAWFSGRRSKLVNVLTGPGIRAKRSRLVAKHVRSTFIKSVRAVHEQTRYYPADRMML